VVNAAPLGECDLNSNPSSLKVESLGQRLPSTWKNVQMLKDPITSAESYAFKSIVLNIVCSTRYSCYFKTHCVYSFKDNSVLV
jgi:hypothetical protein